MNKKKLAWQLPFLAILIIGSHTGSILRYKDIGHNTSTSIYLSLIHIFTLGIKRNTRYNGEVYLLIRCKCLSRRFLYVIRLAVFQVLLPVVKGDELELRIYAGRQNLKRCV